MLGRLLSTRPLYSSFDAVIHTKESPPHKRLVVGRSSPFMQLAEHLTAPLARGTSDVCLIGENPMGSFPALEGCEGLWSYDYGHAWQ